MMPIGATLFFMLRALIVGIIAAALSFSVIFAATQAGFDQSAKLVLMAELAIAGLVGGLAIYGGSWALRVTEPFDMLHWAWQKTAALRAKLPFGK